MKTFTFKTICGFIARILPIVPFALLLVNLGEFTTINDNITLFAMIILGAATLLYLVIMIFVPAEYAIKTDIDVIEFHMWTPQIVSVLLSATIILGLSITMATIHFYPSAIVLFFYSASLCMWPKYIKRIDIASKDHMIAALKSDSV